MGEKGIVAHDAPVGGSDDDARRLRSRLPGLVWRDFVGDPRRGTCGDITYVPTGEGLCRLALVLDFGSGRLSAFATGEAMPWDLPGGDRLGGSYELR